MKKKGLLFSALLFAFLILFTGCSKKKAITSDEFKSKAEAEGYTVTDVQSQYASYGYINQAFVASSADGYQIEFYVLSDKDYAKSMFETNKSIIENVNGNNKVKTEVNLSNYSKFAITTSTKYGYLSRIDNTLIYVNTTKENKNKVSSFIKKLKY